MGLTKVWEPIEIGGVEVKNRIMVSPHFLGYGEDGMVTDQMIEYLRERARGGVGLLGVNTTIAHRYTPGFLSGVIRAYDRACIPGYAELAKALHAEGAKFYVELTGFGVNDHSRAFLDDWHPIYGMSRVPSPWSNEIPAVMDDELLESIVSDFADSAENVIEAGGDGVELHGGHGFLFMQSLSPIFNRRNDRWGGDVQRRCTLVLETAKAIKQRIGDAPLGIRFTFDEFAGAAGITPEMAEEYLEILTASGHFAFFDVTAGSHHAVHRTIAPMSSAPMGFLADYGKRAKDIVGDRAKVFIVGRVKTIDKAEEILEQGQADMVAMTRAHMADPYLVSKAQEGRLSQITKCVGANECIAAGYKDMKVACTVNPAVGRELKWGAGTRGTVATPRKITVVGGGPAGMRCASVAADRGHEVTLIERDPDCGGHLNLLKQLPGREEWQFAVDNLKMELEESGVTVRTGEEATPTSIEGSEVVVCATGSTWDGDGYCVARPDRPAGIPGADAEFVYDLGAALRAVLEDPRALGEKVLIVDDTSGAIPVGLAEMLADAGVEVELVARQLAIAEELGPTFEMAGTIPRLVEKGVKLSPQTFVESIGSSGAVDLYPIWAPADLRTVAADSVVLGIMRTPDQSLFGELESEGRAELHRVGDALTPRMVADSIYEGEKLGREL